MADRETDLEAGYREMAADHKREADAEEWCEGLIGDACARLFGCL
jgi:hypothetical protein